MLKLLDKNGTTTISRLNAFTLNSPSFMYKSLPLNSHPRDNILCARWCDFSFGAFLCDENDTERLFVMENVSR